MGGKKGNSQFILNLKFEGDSLLKGQNPQTTVLISSGFANEILTVIHEYSYEERITVLFQEICAYNNYNKELVSTTNIDDFVIEEILFAASDYDYIENKFKFPLIQSAFENIGSDTKELKVILILWAHCGGEGGIIVRDKNIGFDAGYEHGDFSVIEFGGKKYDYKGFLFEDIEITHEPVLLK